MARHGSAPNVVGTSNMYVPAVAAQAPAPEAEYVYADGTTGHSLSTLLGTWDSILLLSPLLLLNITS